MSITHYYVDPDAGSNASSGLSDALAWETVEYAFANVSTPSAGDGIQINLKDSAVNTLASGITTTAFAPSATLGWTLRGYTSVANDGGIGEIDANNNVLFASTTIDYMNWIDLHCYNSSGDMFDVDNNHAFINCEIHDAATRGIDSDFSTLVMGCNVYDCGDDGIVVGDNGNVLYNYVSNDGTKTMDIGIYIAASSACIGNIVNIDSTTRGIYTLGDRNQIVHNSVYSNGGTGKGIVLAALANLGSAAICNNIVEGFSGAGGAGVDLLSSTIPSYAFSNNSFYDNETDISNAPVNPCYEEGNETLTASAFLRTGVASFANRNTYFAPVDTGSLRGGAFQEG